MAKTFLKFNSELKPLSEVFEHSEGVYQREAELFRVGKVRGQDYTEEDLQHLVDNFDDKELIPIQYDHSESARDTVGYLKAVNLSEGVLSGLVQIIDDGAIQRIEKGLNKKLSISFYTKRQGAKFVPQKIREVSIVAFPQVGTAQLFHEVEEDNKMDNNEIRTQVENELKEQYSQQLQELETLRQEREVQKFAQIDLDVEKFAAEGKILPAQKEDISEFMKSLDEAQRESFSKIVAAFKAHDLDEKGEIGEFGEEDGELEKTELSEDDKFYLEQAARFGTKL